MKVRLISFGARNGVPVEVTKTIGCRGIQNPHRNHKLRYLTGLDEQVRKTVLRHPKADELVNRALVYISESMERGGARGCFGFLLYGGSPPQCGYN